MIGSVVLPCWLGQTGIRRGKREGDDATPTGRYAIAAVLYRADRLPVVPIPRPRRRLRPDMGWCDDPGDRRYNRLVALPYAARHEVLHRTDHLYDLVLVLDYNLARPRPSRGSAIFVHAVAPDLTPTAGCVALRERDLLRLLPRLSARTRLEIA